MKTIYIAPSFKCKQKCICCPIETKSKMLPPLEPEDIIQLINGTQPDKNEELNLIIAGGEPMLYKHFFEILEYLCERKYYLNILSTSTACSDMGFARKMRDIIGNNNQGVKVVSTVYSMNKDIHDAITKVNGSLNAMLTGICNMLDVGINVGIKSIISKPAIDTMPESLSQLDSILPETVEFHISSMDFQGRCRKHADELFISFREIQPHLERTLDLFDADINKSVKRSVFAFDIPLCAVDPYYWKFFFKGSDRVDKLINPDDIIDNPVEACCTDFDECKQCDAEKFCSGVWKSAYTIGKSCKDFLIPIKA